MIASRDFPNLDASLALARLPLPTAADPARIGSPLDAVLGPDPQIISDTSIILALRFNIQRRRRAFRCVVDQVRR
jgi:hypothetical protein